MGVIKQGILGGFSGKVANIVGSSWKGIAVIKSLPLSVANPRTAAQVENRNQFTQSVEFASAILVSTIKPLLDRIAVQMSGYNYFVSKNKDLFDVNGLLIPADLVISEGTVTGLDAFNAVFVGAGSNVDLTWNDNTGAGDALATDILHGCFYNEDLNESFSIPPLVARDAAAQNVVFPAGWLGTHTVRVWGAFRRADGSRASDNNYFTVV